MVAESFNGAGGGKENTTCSSCPHYCFSDCLLRNPSTAMDLSTCNYQVLHLQRAFPDLLLTQEHPCSPLGGKGCWVPFVEQLLIPSRATLSTVPAPISSGFFKRHLQLFRSPSRSALFIASSDSLGCKQVKPLCSEFATGQLAGVQTPCLKCSTMEMSCP